ncbi:MAG: hypothetical protein KKD44_27100 [Proteobacteria bacterium]|nr:hypothetical protein [Pseudomonadota bacterium]
MVEITRKWLVSKLTPTGQYAVRIFEQLEREKRRVEELELQLKDTLIAIPDEDMDEYVQRTQHIISTQAKKFKAFHDEWSSRREKAGIPTDL